MKLKAVASLAATLLLVGCGPTNVQTAAPTAPAMPMSACGDYPEWVCNPVIENGLAAAACYAIPGGNMQIARDRATVKGRAELAKQMEVKVQAMDKEYSRLTNTNQGDSIGGTFESAAKLITEQFLSGSRGTQYAMVNDTMTNTRQMCALVTLSASTKELFDSIVTKSEANLSPANEAVLYERFLAEKAMSEMEQQLQNYRSGN